MSYKSLDLFNLIEESKTNPNVVTIEATVVTGFETAAIDECKEKCRPLKITRAQGRIYFNLSVEDFDKVLKLRAVDNLFLVNDALGVIELSKDKTNDLEIIKSLVHKVDWDRTLVTWAKLVNFNGIIFPLQNTASEIRDSEISGMNKDSAKEDSLNSDSDFGSNQLTVDECAEAVDKINLNEIDEVPPNDSEMGASLLTVPKDRRLSISSDEMYYSAEEIELEEKTKCQPLTDCPSNEELTKTNSQVVLDQAKTDTSNEKPKVDPNILKFRATCYRVGEHSFSSMEAAACFGGALQDKFNWTVNLNNFDLNVILNVISSKFYVCSAITEKSLHRRNISHFGYTTLRPTMCYNMVRLAEPTRGEIIVDPLCGGGSIPIEGSIGFPNTFHICGDNNDKAMNRTLANVDHINKTQTLFVDPIKWSAKRLPLKDSCVDVCVTDLPFGRRSGKKADNLPLYRDVLREMARVSRCGTARAVLLTHDKKSFTKALSGNNNTYWRQIRTVGVNQGGLYSTVFLLLRTAKSFIA